jgi:hypothetical protein
LAASAAANQSNSARAAADAIHCLLHQRFLLHQPPPNTPLTSTSAGPVAKGGMLAMSGVKKRLTKKPAATTSAVMPVRPPSRMPAGGGHNTPVEHSGHTVWSNAPVKHNGQTHRSNHGVTAAMPCPDLQNACRKHNVSY